MVLPINGAVRYNHKSLAIPDIIAGGKERIGFIEAPEIGPRKKTSNAIIPPIAIPVNFFSFFACTTIRITPIRKIVAIISTP